ncbi:MAG: DsbE family thiol:disulfide interchange protein [Gammaproteobacteria bacterium]|nr:MAG: DsbE family thiol:disulfide interchange protein [Gammaproteobacteria bacterium]
MMRYAAPLVLFLLLAVLLAYGLRLDPRRVPSPLIGKPAPAFSLPTLKEPDRHFSPDQMKGRFWLLNVWASWCVACRDEHPYLIRLAREAGVPIIGLDYKDSIPGAHQWLKKLGNPYYQVAVDADGRVGIDWGVYGVPETFLIDPEGVIRYKQIGPLTPEDWEREFLPLIRSTTTK